MPLLAWLGQVVALLHMRAYRPLYSRGQVWPGKRPIDPEASPARRLQPGCWVLPHSTIRTDALLMLEITGADCVWAWCSLSKCVSALTKTLDPRP